MASRQHYTRRQWIKKQAWRACAVLINNQLGSSWATDLVADPRRELVADDIPALEDAIREIVDGMERKSYRFTAKGL